MENTKILIAKDLCYKGVFSALTSRYLGSCIKAAYCTMLTFRAAAA